MPKAQQVNAWASYDNTAKAARRLQSDGQAPLRQRKITRHSTSAVQNDQQALKDLEGGYRRASVAENADLAAGNVSRHRTSRVFLDLMKLQKLDDGEEVEQVDRNKEKEEESGTKKLFDLDCEDILKIREAVPIFFDTELHEKGGPAQSSIQTFLASLNATMPWVQDRLHAEPLIFFEMCLRGIGQVYFQNSPLSGLLVLIALFLQSPTVAVHGILGLVCGNLVALGLGFDKGLARSGLFGYNSLLVGLAVATFDVNTEYHAAKILMVILFASFSSVVFVMFGKLLVPYKSPPLTFPFIIATLMFLLSTANMDRVEFGSVRSPSLPNYSNSEALSAISWNDFFAGTLRGVGQVYLANNIASGALILAAIAVCSRISAVAAILGSALGAAIALATGVPAPQVAQGMYGFNASLSVTAMLMFYNPSIGASILAVFSGIMSVVAQQALASVLQPLGLPFMTLPFCVVSLSFIIIQGTTSLVLAVPLADMTVPEDHLHRIYRLEDGINFLKEAVLNDENRRMNSRKLRKSFKMIQSAVYEKEAKLGDVQPKSSSSLEGLFSNHTEEVVKARAHALFRLLAQKTGQDRLTIQTILDCFRDAGMEEGEPIMLASLMLNLADHTGDKTIDEIEFVCFAMVASAAKLIRTKLFKFFDFVDADCSGSIDFHELDVALEYLGRSPFTHDEKQRLIKLSKTMTNEDDDIETVELMDIVTIEKVKSLLGTF
ncbi:unnamed protein product [Cylindrotheca closterium]|uniref:EF-hand domain-containing protein n=1 Tax=Cylindrotheca closterium TaxID=2856 RepID=A0AAD2PX03_9STRA|nr:unnamed protein product [Cylindrotheca closterium]